MGDAGIINFSKAVPGLVWFTPEVKEYKERRFTYCASNPAVPRAILCPRDAEEVSAIVRLCRESNIPFSVRTGGHDLHGRSVVQDAFCVDMRGIDFVKVADDRKTAVIGGGIQFEKLLPKLHEHGLITPHGSVPAIGYVGWASLGGYGCASTNFGLGVDQILEAEVVNDRGEIVAAEEEMMRGIRGAGGNFGVITSLKIKVYEVKNILAGMVLFDVSENIQMVFKHVIQRIQELEAEGKIPCEVVLQPMVINTPAGRSFGITYIWSSNDHEKGKKKLEELIEQLPGTVVMNTVTEMSPPEWVSMLDNFVATSVWGGGQAISFGALSSRVLDIIGERLVKMPTDPGTCLSMHMLSKKSPSVTNLTYTDASTFNPEARKPHTMIEIIGSAMSEDSMERCEEWATTMRKALFASGEAMKGSYVSLIGPETMSLDDIYGEKIGLLRQLKQKYDPDGIFRYAVPRMLD